MRPVLYQVSTRNTTLSNVCYKGKSVSPKCFVFRDLAAKKNGPQAAECRSGGPCRAGGGEAWEGGVESLGPMGFDVCCSKKRS